MKRNLFIAVALFATMTASAQNIAAVSPGNETTIYQTLGEAVNNAANGSVIYLPGGGFQIPDSIKINKPLTIMGVSHRGDTDNADGATAISGNLNFDEGSSGSSVIGAYVSGAINVGTAEKPVTNITIRFCNVGSIQVKHSESSGLVINQCYIRGLSSFKSSNPTITNNITSAMVALNGAMILNNVFVKNERVGDYYAPILEASNSTISYNVFLSKGWSSNGRSSDYHQVRGDNNQSYLNMTRGIDWGENCINVGDVEWTDIFDRNAGISIMSKYHFKGEYTQYEDQIGIYGGSGFKDGADAHAPIPRIVSKKVAEQTDGSGRLHIEVTVKSN